LISGSGLYYALDIAFYPIIDLKHMRLFSHHFLRVLVVLLTAVLITNTVYAGSMMVSASFGSMSGEPAQTELAAGHAQSQHCHDQDGMEHHHDSDALSVNNQSSHPSPSHHSCGQCNHCMACFSMMVYDQVNIAAILGQPVLAVATGVLYLAPAHPQPSKPPIA